MTRNPKKYRQEKKILLIIAVLILAAVICRLFSRFDVVDDATQLFMFAVAIDHFTWGSSSRGVFRCRRRVLNRSVRRYLMAIAALLLFWFVIRTCKFLFLEGMPCVTVLLLVRLLHTDDTDPSDGDLSCMLSWKTGKLHVADSIKGDYRSGDPVYYTDPYQ